jgi:hypothetical protein
MLPTADGRRPTVHVGEFVVSPATISESADASEQSGGRAHRHPGRH